VATTRDFFIFLGAKGRLEMPMKKAKGSKYCFKMLEEGYSLKAFFTKLLDQS
jgi:hypothetical protein